MVCLGMRRVVSLFQFLCGFESYNELNRGSKIVQIFQFLCGFEFMMSWEEILGLRITTFNSFADSSSKPLQMWFCPSFLLSIPLRIRVGRLRVVKGQGVRDFQFLCGFEARREGDCACPRIIAFNSFADSSLAYPNRPVLAVMTDFQFLCGFELAKVYDPATRNNVIAFNSFADSRYLIL